MTHDDDMLRELHASGLSLRLAAKSIGWTKERLAGKWWRMGLRRKRPCLSEQENEQRRLLRLRGDERTRHDRNRCRRPMHTPRIRMMPPERLFVNPEDKRAGR